MRDLPILFKGRLVRAILGGHKTQTRRIAKPPKDFAIVGVNPDGWPIIATGGGGGFRGVRTEVLDRSPYGVPGDRLWVREAFRLRADQDDKPPRDDWWKSGAWYAADGPGSLPSGCAGGAGKLRPSIHMPRWASRINLNVVGVRVEPLQDISDSDVLAEGVDCEGETIDRTGLTKVRGRTHFKPLWDSINAKRAPWSDNPWVWVVDFRRLP